MDLGINGKKALVCAASKGLGRAVARALASEGTELFLCSRSADSLADAVREMKSLTSYPVHSLACDLTDAASRERLVSEVESTMGGVDILVHNVGGPPPTTALETTTQQWEDGFQRLFMSVAQLNEAFIPGMRKNRWGRIAIVTSSSVYEPVPNLAVSNAMRAAVTNMAKTLADELAPENVTINCIAPGVIHTDRTEERIKAAIAKSGGSREALLDNYTAEIPMGRLGTPDEYGAVVAFACSDKASYMTGATLVVDGGKRRSTV